MRTASPRPSRWLRPRAIVLGGCLLTACGARTEPAVAGASAAGSVRLASVAAMVGGAPHLTLRGVSGPEVRSDFKAVDPCVVRVHGEQFTTSLVEIEGELRVPLGVVPQHDAVVGLSTVARPTGTGFASEHHKAIVAAGGADGEPVPTTAVTARLGLRAELTPLRDPCVLGAGDTLPLRLSLDLADPAGVTLQIAYSPRPDVEPEFVEVRTRALGFADISLRGPGEYVVAAVATVGRLDGARERVSVSLAFAVGGGR